MKRILQINVTANWGSTGRIAEQINSLARNQGWDTFIAYGRACNTSQSNLLRVGSSIDVYEHYAEHRLFDNDGLASRNATAKLVMCIREISPDVIHLHNIHDHWLNYHILFDYLKNSSIPVVWTQHDCWGFTGGCAHFTSLNCYKWKTCCDDICSFRQGSLSRMIINHTKKQYELKKRLFAGMDNLYIVTVSKWLEDLVRQSFLKDKKIQTIYNGVDVNTFKPINDGNVLLRKYHIDGLNYVVGVASTWTKTKGFNDYLKLAAYMPSNYKIVLVGLSKRQCKEAGQFGIIAIPRTDCIEDLVAIYNGASIVLNLSYEETFGLTTVEGFACGTPGVVYNCTASPELIKSKNVGIVVEPGNVEGVSKAIRVLLDSNHEKMSMECRNVAQTFFDKSKLYADYVTLYDKLRGGGNNCIHK